MKSANWNFIQIGTRAISIEICQIIQMELQCKYLQVLFELNLDMEGIEW